ncbi:MAG: hypothetical protein RL641_645 [Candidatus Parcubacteria bacterium]|jgi:prepilin-type N-terminal cleavage/methylation domain-containing protein
MPSLFYRKNKQEAFTLVEVLLVLAIILILTAGAINIFSGFLFRNNVDVGVRQLREHLRKAQFYSMTLSRNSGWGVYLGSSSATLFCLCPGNPNLNNTGIDYITRDPAYDEKISLPSGVTLTGFSGQNLEIHFDRLTGFASTVPVAGLPVTINVTSDTDEVRTLTTYQEGTVAVN